MKPSEIRTILNEFCKDLDNNFLFMFKEKPIQKFLEDKQNLTLTKLLTTNQCDVLNDFCHILKI